MGKALLVLVTAWVLTIGLALAAGTAWAVSYLVVAEGPVQVTEGAPPCHQKRVTTFKVTLRNDNGPLLFCTEDVDPVRQARAIGDDQGEFEIKQHPPGSLNFLGFKMSADGDEYENTLKFIGMEAGADKAITFYFDVETGPVNVPLLGLCDFQEAEFAITICDGGGGCDLLFWADLPDPFCESPAKFTPSVRLEADRSFCPASETGTASVQGTVRDLDGQPMRNARVHLTRGCSGQPGFVERRTDTPNLPPSARGTYAFPALPGPAVYTVEARADGKCATATVNVPQAGASVVQDFTLANTCN